MKVKDYLKEIKELWQTGQHSKAEIAEYLKKKYRFTIPADSIRKQLSVFLQAETKAITPKLIDLQSDADIKDSLKQLFKKKDLHTFESLADHYNLPPKKIKLAISELEKAGFNIKVEHDKILFSNIIPTSPSKIIQAAKHDT
jgi:biotin operon repressor